MERLSGWRQDIQYALRTLRRAPVLTAVASVTLALGIGATSAMFSLVDGILLRPLPYPHPEQLVRVIQSYPEKGLDTWSLSQENVALYRDRGRDFSAFAAYWRRAATLGGERPERLLSTRVTGDFFKVLGVAPAFGRAINPADDTPLPNNVAVLSDAFWHSHFGGDPNVLGKTIDLDGKPYAVVGVMPAGFSFPRPPSGFSFSRTDVSVWIPLGLDPTKRFGWFLTGIGRLRGGASAQRAERETTGIMWDWARGQPGLLSVTSVQPERTRMKTLVTPLREAVVGDTAKPLAVLQAAVVLILLIAIANVATLLSSRAAARGRELGIRTALGATRGRIVRQLLTESVALGVFGGALGVALAAASVRAFTHSASVTLPRVEEVSLDTTVLLVTAVVAILSGIVAGLAPAFRGMREGLIAGFSPAPRDTAHRGTRRLNNALVITQLALSVVLLVSAGLVLKSFQQLVRVDLGFQARNVTSVALPLPERTYAGLGRVAAFSSTLRQELEHLPGVRDAAVASTLPYSGGVNTDGYLVEGAATPSAGAETQTVQQVVSPGYFATLGISLPRGRDFVQSDDSTSLPVVIVDEALARRHWPDGNAIGKRMRLTGDTTWLTIVGVAGSVRDEEVAGDPRPHSYFPLAQVGGNRLTLAIRTAGDPSGVLPAIRSTIARLEPGVPLDAIRPLEDFIGHALDTNRITEVLLAGFALLALVLAVVGIYGVMALYVANRRREFGIRLAVGAQPGNVLRLVLGEGTLLTLTGVGAGIAGALVATRWIRSLLFGVSATDPLVFGAIAVGLVLVAVASCYAPARRAAASDPLLVLRAE